MQENKAKEVKSYGIKKLFSRFRRADLTDSSSQMLESIIYSQSISTGPNQKLGDT